MSECFIGLGKCSYFYFYILGDIISNALRRLLFKLDIIIIKHYFLVQNVYQFLGYIIFGILLNYILKKSLNKNNRNEDNSITRRNIKSSKLIYNDSLKFSKKNILSFIIICSIYAFYNIIDDIVRFYKFNNLIFWTFDLAFVLILMNCYFPQNFYKHQIYPMIFVIIFGTISLIF